MPAVSVVIPTYNHRDLIRETLDSIFAQTFMDYEVIVVDDGSTDDTVDVLAPLADAGKIRLIRQKNTGQAAARNHGIAAASGEYIALLDDDDLWPVDKLEWQLAALRENNWVAVGGSCSVLRDQHKAPPAFGPPGVITVARFFCGSPFHSPGQVMMRRSAFAEVGGFDASIWGVDDLDLYIRLANLGPFGAIDQLSLYYRMHDGNASRQADRMFQNGARVIQKNLPLVPLSQRPQARQEGYRWLYRHLGGQVVREALRSMDPRKWAAGSGVWFCLALPALRDSFLFRAIIWEVIPCWLRQRLESSNSSSI